MTVSDSDVPPPDPAPEDGRELRHLQRMAMLGVLAAGLGHDLRNLAMPVLLRLDALDATDDVSSGQARRDLASIRQSMIHLQRLASGLRLLSSDPFDQRDEAQYTLLAEWWTDMAAVVHDALPHHAVLDAAFPADLPPVAVPPAVLAQVLVNLVVNARRAMDATERPALVLGARPEAGSVYLAVSDNGRGMDAETQQRCFEPYFTTRPRERATGLGLPLGRALMQRHGGDLRLTRTGAGSGATFTIVLPLGHAGGAVRVSDREVRLLVREPRRLAVVRHVVSQHGFRELEQAAPGDPALVICDSEFLSSLFASGDGDTVRSGRRRIIAIGERSGVQWPDEVRWIDPAGLSELGVLLA